jgi:Ca2+/Na+ antiporter
MQLKTVSIIYFILTALVFIYVVFLLKYLGNAEKCDKIMTKSDKDFRKAAYVITWIIVVLYGLALIGSISVMINIPSGIEIGNISSFRGI